MVFKYKILPHPADIRLQITASAKTEIFQAALKGMASILSVQPPEKTRIIRERIEIQSLDINALLIDCLNGILTKSDIYNCVFDEITIEELTEQKIKGIIKGYQIEEFQEEIKAVTYHGLKIKQNKEGNFTAVILFDI